MHWQWQKALAGDHTLINNFLEGTSTFNHLGCTFVINYFKSDEADFPDIYSFEFNQKERKKTKMFLARLPRALQ